jgi:hypothetical protein
MKLALVAALLALVGWTPILAAGTGSPPPVPEPVKCVQCVGNQCHAVYGPGSQYCVLSDGGCNEVGDCGGNAW